MNTKHTEGLCIARERTDGSMIVSIGDPQKGPHNQGDVHLDPANVRRLAACWNACEGLSTARLKEMPMPFVQTIPAMLAQADELLKALEGMVSAHAVPSSICKERPAYDAAIAIIAKVKGGAT